MYRCIFHYKNKFSMYFLFKTSIELDFKYATWLYVRFIFHCVFNF